MRRSGPKGSGQFTRISWDEALEIIVAEINRVKNKYGTAAILSQQDGHGETKAHLLEHGTFGHGETHEYGNHDNGRTSDHTGSGLKPESH